MEHTTTSTFPILDLEEAKQKVLNWAKRFNTFCFLDNHQYQLEPHTHECLLAAGVKRSISANAGNALQELAAFMHSEKSWLFGHLSYDLKNEIEVLHSVKEDPIGFADLFFFEPEILVRLSNASITIEAVAPRQVFEDIFVDITPANERAGAMEIKKRFSKDKYIAVIDQLKRHILRGDCYEINFCQEFFVGNCKIDATTVYQELSKTSPNPFSALYRNADSWLICASPERFLCKRDGHILSQPIKGTASRVPGDEEQDWANKASLQLSVKDRSENVMIVDLVRNDLSKICVEGSVVVDELFAVHSFPQVHQMISTVSGEVRKGLSFADIIRATFPMGSMTGAPKKRVMELIDQYEPTKRGIFSGALGYITPSGDFDLNVVIRSIMYNASSGYLSFLAGSGITWYSEAEKEWEECLLKARAIEEILTRS